MGYFMANKFCREVLEICLAFFHPRVYNDNEIKTGELVMAG